MNFKEWVEHERGEDSKTTYLREFSKKCGVSVQTLQFVARGTKVSFYHKAQAISAATDGAVSVTELCE